MHPLLKFQQTQKFFDGKPVLLIPSQMLDKGIYWLQGPNGSGKTTLLRMIAGILPFQGDIVLLGRSQRKDPAGYRRLVGWADAEPLYPAFLTGEDLIGFYTGILHPDPRQVQELMQRLEVQGWINTRVGSWSSGMIKKLALVLAFLSQPVLITLDEPLITLDAAGTRTLIALINEYHYDYGTSFLVTSHQQFAADQLTGTRLLLVKDKSIQLID